MLGSSDLGARSPSGVVTAGPWNARDRYGAEAAALLDRLTAKIDRLERREEALAQHVADLMAQADQVNRLGTLADSLRNAREMKLDQTMLTVRVLRERVDALEGPRAAFAALDCKSLVAVAQRLSAVSEAMAAPPAPVRRFHWGSALAGAVLAAVAAGAVGLAVGV